MYTGMTLINYFNKLIFLLIFVVKQVFPDMEFVGWYTNGDTPTSDDTLLHEQVLIIVFASFLSLCYVYS